MPLTTVSLLRTDLSPDRVNVLVATSLARLKLVSETVFKGRDYAFRDIMPGDWPGNANQEYTETSGGTDNAWAATAFGNGGVMADDRIMCVWGMTVFDAQTTSGRTPPVSAFRFNIGSSIRTQVSLYHFWAGNVAQSGTAAGAIQTPARGYLMTPIIITPNQPVTVDEYVITTSAIYIPFFYGATSEIVGRTLTA